MKSLVVVFLTRSASAPPALPSLKIGVSTLMLLGSPAPARWAGASRLATGRRPLSAERKDARGMAASLDEMDEVLRRQPRGRGVHEGMAVYLGKVEQCRVD